jgi:hypothetical protein
MTKQTINTGAGANDGTGDSLRDGAGKVNNNFTELYNALGNGSSLQLNLSGATAGQILAYNGANFVPSTSGTIAYNAIQADTGTGTATAGNTTLGIQGAGGVSTSITGNILTISSSGGGSGGGASVTVSTTAPSNPTAGDLWYDSELGILAVWFSEEAVWVQSNGGNVIENFNGDVQAGITTFLGMSDTPGSFTGQENNIVRVNSTGTALEFISSSSQAADALTPVDVDSALSPYSASAYELIFVDSTDGPITITLPSGPTKGDEVRIVDIKGTFAANACTVSSSAPIQGDSEDLIIDINRASLGLLYHSSLNGWVLKDR